MNKLTLCFVVCFLSAMMSCNRSTEPDDEHPAFHVTLSSPATSLRVSDSTTVTAQDDLLDSVACTYDWHATIGRIEGNGHRVVYVAPDTSGEAVISVRLRTDSAGEAEDSISLVIYKQFVILKADDLTAEAGKSLSPRWEKFIDYVLARGLKAGLGLIGNSLEDPSPVYVQRVQDACLSGHFEVWNHGYDHILDEAGEYGDTVSEFSGTSYEYQMGHLLKTQNLAQEKLGITLHTFGAPGNKFDQNTAKVIDDADDIQVWLFGDVASTKLALGRYGEIEFPTHHPDYQQFLQGYDSEMKYLVFQIHPKSWDDAAFEEFKKIIDCLTAAGVTFVTPDEYYLLNNSK